MFSSSSNNMASKAAIVFSGFLFAISWWIMIDQTYFVKSFYGGPGTFRWFFFLAPVVSTLGIFLTWFISRNSVLDGGNTLASAFGDDDTKIQRILLFLFLTIMFSGVLIAVYFHVILDENRIDQLSKNASVSLIIGSLGVSLSGLILKFCRARNTSTFF